MSALLYTEKNKGTARDAKSGVAKQTIYGSGMKADHIGSDRKGIFSITENEKIKENIKKRERNLGNSAASFIATGDDGKPIPFAKYNLNGRMFTADGDGRIRLVDTQNVKESLKAIKEREDYIDKVMDYVVYDDHITADIFQMNLDYFEKVCNAKGPGMTDYGIPESVNEYNCLPSLLRTLDEHSTLYGGGLSKLRALVSAIMPIFDFTMGEDTGKLDPKEGMD